MNIRRFFAITLALIIVAILAQSAAASSPKTSEIKASVNEGTVSLTWDGVKDAKKYAVYRSTEKKGVYSYLGTSTATNYKDNTATKGNTYFYSYKSLISKKWSPLTKPIAVCIPDDKGYCKIPK